MSKLIERKHDDVFRKLLDDGGDRVTAEHRSDTFHFSAVTRDCDSVETEEEKVSDGDGADAPVTADSRCENSCHPVTRLGTDNGKHLFSTILFQFTTLDHSNAMI